MLASIKTFNSRIFIKLRIFKPEHNETVHSDVHFLTNLVTNLNFIRQIPTLLGQLKMPTFNSTWLSNVSNNIAVRIPQDIFQQGPKNLFVPTRCITFTSISFTSTFCMMPGYGSPSNFTTHHWPIWDSSAAFDSRPGSGILSSSACEGPNSIEVRLKQEQGPVEQEQLRILDCINLDLLVRT